MKTKIVIGLLVAVVGVATWYFISDKSKNDSVDLIESTTTTERTSEGNPSVPDSTTTGSGGALSVSPTKTFMLAEIARHASRTDCWFSVEGKVYDVTKFIESGKHSGGEAILEGCGKDATALFNTRPMGSGTPHSSKAREGLANFYIGELDK